MAATTKRKASGADSHKPSAPASKSKNKTNAKKRITPKKPKAAVLRVMKKKEPKIVENTKVALLLKGLKTSEVVSTALKDLVSVEEEVEEDQEEEWL